MSVSFPVEAKAIHKRYPDGDTYVDVLRGVDLQIAAGELVALLGPSGSGKSSLLHVLGALDPDYRGDVVLAGETLASLNDARRADLRARAIGFVFQSYNLLEHLTAQENILLAARFGDAPADPSRADALLEQVGLAGKGHRQPTHLSGGERQRVAIARALYHRPPIILCDEPTGNLDRDTAHRILDLFEELRGAHSAMLMVTHDPDLGARADRVLRIEGGRIQ